AAVLRYLQDIAGRDASRAQLFGDGYWVARRTVIEFFAPIPAWTALEIETYPRGFTKVTAQRHYEVRVVRGGAKTFPDPVIRARTVWVFINSNGRPARIPESYHQFWELSGGHSIQEEAAWPPYPDRLPFTATAPVRFSDLDVQAHMNNAAYVELLDNAAWEAFAANGILPDSSIGYPIPLHYDIEYLESARAGEMLEVRSWFEPLSGQANGFELLQQVLRKGTVLIRAHSRWKWQTPLGLSEVPDFEQLWKSGAIAY
ncbi:MAG: thioesterase family protein, partial [Chloroflexota bacterium]